jgi:uncharacterized protein (DUF1800 family)
MADQQRELMAHLLRRAGAGTSHEELETYAARPYEDVVDDLVHPERFPEPDDDLLTRYFPSLVNSDTPMIWSGRWIYRMVNTQRPLEEKMALFWHHVFATAWFKAEHGPSIPTHIQMLRDNCLTNMRELLLGLSRDPAMIYWLDNCENYGAEPNENFGRELLELFSMGLGNYSESDVKAAAYAFTGWTFEQPIPLYPYGGYPARFVYKPEEHDDSDKTFLGVTGPLDGEDIIDIIVKQPATARFIARHLYNFFIGDEPQVPAWSIQEPEDKEGVEAIAKAFMERDGDMREVMKALFNSDSFKTARFTRVKCPAEFVAGTLKLSGEIREPDPQMWKLNGAMAAMGQTLMDPPSVEGWHTGKEWIDGGTLMERINFAADHVGDATRPGTRDLVERLAAQGETVAPERFVDTCLDQAGPLAASEQTRRTLLDFANEGGDLRFDGDEAHAESARRVARMLTLVVAAPEYQFA